MYFNPETLEQSEYDALVQSNKQSSLPLNGTAILLNSWHFIFPSDVPAFDSVTHKANKVTPALTAGKYHVEYSVDVLSQEDSDVMLASEIASKLIKLNNEFDAVSVRPRVNTGLGFFVDGNHNDLLNFQTGRDLGLLSIMDADNQEQTIILSDYDTIITAIQVHGLSLLQNKWVHSANINALTTSTDLNGYDITTGW